MSATVVACAECGTDVVIRYPSLLRPRNYCNRTCLGAYRSKHYRSHYAASWKGGVTKDRGRVLYHMPGYHLAQADGYVYRYRLMAEEKLGRRLRHDEIIHHIDGDETNDDMDNLIVTTQAVHASQYDARRLRRAHGELQPR